MKKDWKQILGDILGTVFILAIGGGVTLFASVIAFMGIVPLYVAKVTPIVLGFGVLCLALMIWVKQPASGKIKKGYLAIVLACVVFVGFSFGYDLYLKSVPEMDNREDLVFEYTPNAEGSLAVRLEEESTLKFDEITIRMDGATALYPVYAAFVQAVSPDQVYDPWDYSYESKDGLSSITCSGTNRAYERLINGRTDVIFVAGPSDAQLAMAKAAGVELHLTPIGREAFVFFVNAENPVTGLTVEQIQKIYTGEIKNWREVGGKFQKILPYQRAENSGSQTALQRLMGDLPLMEPKKEERIGGMGGIITSVANYRNFKNAIGFSFRFYSTEMVKNDQIRLLALNGVEPTVDTIRDGSYPISSSFYAITASPIGQPAPEETNEDLAALINWILSEQGQWLIEETGYVGIG